MIELLYCGLIKFFFYHLRAHGLGKGDEHPAYTPVAVRHTLAYFYLRMAFIECMTSSSSLIASLRRAVSLTQTLVASHRCMCSSASQPVDDVNLNDSYLISRVNVMQHKV